LGKKLEKYPACKKKTLNPCSEGGEIFFFALLRGGKNKGTHYN
jgi:hypothetical protein